MSGLWWTRRWLFTTSSLDMVKSKNELLEVMRGFAAVWVLFHHTYLATDHFVGRLGPAPWLANGYLGVDFFFVLSGFIIALSSHRLAAEGKGLADYFQARAIRIYTPYLPVGLAMFMLYTLLPGISQGGRELSLWTSVTLLPADTPPALSVAWTLVHEVIFYLVFAVWFVSRKVFYGLASIWAITILTTLALDVHLTRFPRYFLSPLNLYFLLGIGVFLISQKVPPNGKTSLSLALLGVLLVSVQASLEVPDRVWVGLGFASIVFATTSPQWQNIRTARWILMLGTASYSIYLTHDPMLSLAVRVVTRVFPDLEPWTAYFPLAAIGLIAGLLYWALYERHAIRFLRVKLAR